jgi:hypothetical protein
MQPKPKAEVLPVSCIDATVFKKSRGHYDENNLITFLLSKYPEEKVSELISLYHIGTSKHWPGSTIFWQLDTVGRIRSGKIMLYHSGTGKRIKAAYDSCKPNCYQCREDGVHITWAHKAMGLENYNLQQCLFGETSFATIPG